MKTGKFLNMGRMGIMGMMAVAVILICSGCATMDGFGYGQDVESRPGAVTATNTILETNIVTELSTNALTGEVTATERHILTPRLTYSYGPPILTTNLVPRPQVESAISAVGLLPFPWSGPLALGLGWAYSAWAALRNKKRAIAILKSVETGRKFLQETPEGKKFDAQFKTILANEQAYDGVVAEVHAMLDRYVRKN